MCYAIMKILALLVSPDCMFHGIISAANKHKLVEGGPTIGGEVWSPSKEI